MESPFRLAPPLSVVPISLSQSSSPLLREEFIELLQKQAVERVQDWELPALAIPSPKKEWKVTSSNRSFYTKSIYKETTFQDGDSQVSKTTDIGKRLGCHHRPDGCVSSCTNSSAIQKIPSVHLRTLSLPFMVLPLGMSSSVVSYQV